MWQLKFDHHLDNQFLFSSFMFLLFFVTQIWSPHVWGGLKWYHGVHKDCDQVHPGHCPCHDWIPIREKSEKNRTKWTKFVSKSWQMFFLKHGIDDKIFGFNFWHQNSVKIRHHKTNEVCSQKVGKCFFSKTWNWSLMTKKKKFNFWDQNSVKIRHKKPRRNHWSDSCYGRLPHSR